MKNSKLRRALLLLACAVMLVSLSVGATLAYLSSTTKVVNNTFTVGKVVISLDEALVDQYGNPLGIADYEEDGTPIYYPVDSVEMADRTTKNQYKLYPGKSYPKDPTVTVNRNSESCYVFVMLNKTGLTYTKTIKNEDGTQTTKTVDIEANADDDYTRIEGQILANGWKVFDEENHIYVYEKIVNTLVPAGQAGEVKLPVFTNFKIAEYADVPVEAANPNFSNQLAELQIKIIAYAIQAEGFGQNLANTTSDNSIQVDMGCAQAAWNAAKFNTSFDQ